MLASEHEVQNPENWNPSRPSRNTPRHKNQSLSLNKRRPPKPPNSHAQLLLLPLRNGESVGIRVVCQNLEGLGVWVVGALLKFGVYL